MKFINRVVNYFKQLLKKEQLYYNYSELSEDAKFAVRANKTTEMVNTQNILDWKPRLLFDKVSIESSINRFETYEHSKNCKLFDKQGQLISVFTLDNLPIKDIERIESQYAIGDQLYVDYKNKWKPGLDTYSTFIIDINKIPKYLLKQNIKRYIGKMVL